MNDDARNTATPIDAYVAVGRRLGLDPNLIIQLRRIGAFNSLSAEEACSMVDAMSAVFGPDLAEEILRDNPADYRSSIGNVEPRVSRILNLCQGLSRQDVLRMMRRSPKTFTVDGETFSALLESAAKLVPDNARRWTFLYAFPAYFSLNPVIVSECVARGITEATYQLDHPALWHALQAEQTARNRLEQLMRDLRYNETLCVRYLERLYKDLGSYHAGLAFLSDLLDSGWTKADLRDALGAYNYFRLAGSERIREIQRVLTETFGMPLMRVIVMLVKKPSILQASLETFEERIRAALPFPTQADVERLLLKAPALLLQDSDVTALRRAELIASGEHPDANPAILVVRQSPQHTLSATIPDEPDEPIPEPPDADATEEPTSILEDENVPKPLAMNNVARKLEGFGYDDERRMMRIHWLTAWLGSEEAVLAVLGRLLDAGWNAHALDALLSHRRVYAPEAVDRLLELHGMFVHDFGVKKHVAAYIVSVTPTITEVPVDVLGARIRAALGSPTPRAVERLVLCADRALRLSATALVRRRTNLEARGIRVDVSPRRILHKIAETPPKKRGAEDEYSPPPSIAKRSVPECATAIQAFEFAGWNRRDAMLHLRAFTDLKHVNPTQLCHSLIRLKAVLGISGDTFTRRLNENTRALVFNRDALMDSHLPTTDGKRRTLTETREGLTPDQAAEAKRIAVGVHALDPDPTRSEHTTEEALGVLRVSGFRAGNAKTFLQQYPELLTDDARPLALAYWLLASYRLGQEDVMRNLRDPDSRMALFLHPDALRKTINERRSLAIEYDELHMNPRSLDPCLAWSRVFCPTQEIAFRLELLLDMGERPGQTLLKNLHAPSRAAFVRLINTRRTCSRKR